MLRLRVHLVLLFGVAALAAVLVGGVAHELGAARADTNRLEALSLARGLAAGLDPDDRRRPARLRERTGRLRNERAIVRQATLTDEQGRPLYQERTVGDARLGEVALPLPGSADRAADGEPAATTLALTVELTERDAGLVERLERVGFLAAGFGLVTLVGLALALERLVLEPLRRLAAHAHRARFAEPRPGELSERRDEVGAVARDVDRLAADLAVARQELDDASPTDPLTGLLRGDAFFDALAIELRRAQREGYRVAVVAVRLDALDRLVEGWGARAGEEALRLVAQVMAAEVRPSDLCGRLGPDRFALALSQTGGQEAEDVVARLRVAIGAVEFLPLGQPLTVSTGTASFPYDAAEATALVAFADQVRADSLRRLAAARGRL